MIDRTGPIRITGLYMFMKIATVGNFVILEQFFSPTVGQGLRDPGMLLSCAVLFFL